MTNTKVILAFGDSLTYGTIAGAGTRHAYEDRWPTVLEGELDGAARVIPEGLGGRTTVFDDHAAAADRNGGRVLPTLLSTHSPLDLVIIFLGTNDIKQYINGTAFGAAMGVKRLVEIIRTHPYNADAHVPEIVIVAPPLTVPTRHVDPAPMFAPRGDEARLFDPYYSRIAADLGCAYLDSGKVAVADPADGVHLDAANTRAVGKALVPVARQVLGL